MLIYNFLFMLILVCYITSNIAPQLDKIILWSLGLILIIFAGLRAPGVDNDSTHYYFTFEHVNNIYDVLSGSSDLMALLLPYLLKTLGIYSIASALLVFAFIGVGLKLRAFVDYSPIPLLSILLYFSFYFIKQEMTTIRAGIAVSFMLWSIVDIKDKNYLAFYAKIIAACFFHLSAIIFIGLIFMDSDKLKRWQYFLLLNLSFLLGLTHVNLIVHIPIIGGLFSKISYYSMAKASALEANTSFLSVVNLFYILLLNYYIYCAEYLSQQDRYAIIFIKLSIYAMALLFVFFSLSAIVAGRAFEMFGIAINFSMLYLFYLFKPRWLVLLFIILYAAYFFVAVIYRSPLVGPYITSL